MQDMAKLKINELLEERGMTPYRLALETGLNHATISKLRHNKAIAVRLDVIDKLCEVLKCDAGELIEVAGAKRKARG